MDLLNFCDFCQTFIAFASHSVEDPGAHTLQKKTCFKTSAVHCSFCRFIYDELLRRFGKAVVDEYDTDDFLPHTASVYFDWSKIPVDEERICACDILLETQTEQQKWEVFLNLWADEKTPGAETFKSRGPIFENDSLQTYETFINLLAECVSNHYRCSLSKASGLDVADHEPELPTRVLEIGGETPDAAIVRLVETKGRQGLYCALSHCWGPPEKQPIRTLSANIRNHLVNIPIDDLPKTFREAAFLTRQLGVSYLWIDSLCIVQDDEEDWEREAKIMGSLYEKAVLVIAAAGSRDSTEGLMVSDRSDLCTIRLPYIKGFELSNAFFFVATVPDGAINPDKSVLNERGWVYQEWYLARRILFAMPGGFVWSCLEFNTDERGSRMQFDSFNFEHGGKEWLDILQPYTSKKLTFASDRLPALQGIAGEMERSDRRRGRFVHGVWDQDQDLVHQILWKSVAEPMQGQEDVPQLPSWTWASTGTEKYWIVTYYSHEWKKALNQLPETIQVQDTGFLSITSGTLVELFLRESRIDHAEARQIEPYWEGYGNQTEESVHWMKSCSYPCYLMREMVSDHIVGLAVFDKGFVANVACFLLASISRHLGSVLNPQPGYRPDHDLYHKLNWEKRSIHTDIGRELYQAALSDQVYWAILMVPAGDAKFRRVGIGLLYPSARQHGKESIRSFQIT